MGKTVKRMTKTRYSLRQKISLAALVLLALNCAWRNLDEVQATRTIRRSDEDRISYFVKCVESLRCQLPRTGRIGFVDEAGAEMTESNALKRYVLAQYAAAPLLLNYNRAADTTLIIHSDAVAPRAWWEGECEIRRRDSNSSRGTRERP